MNKLIAVTVMMFLLAGSVLAYSVIIGPFDNGVQAQKYQNDPTFYNALGYKLSQEGKNGEAQAAFAHAVILNPDYKNARSNLATIAFANKDYATAIDNLRYLAAQDAANKDYQFDLAQNLVSQARYVDYDIKKLEEGAAIYENLGSYPHAKENAAIVRTVLAEVATAQANAAAEQKTHLQVSFRKLMLEFSFRTAKLLI
jgi:Flp pilus assembly protein TadD